MIGERIREARTKAKHNQTSLAELINTSPKNVSRWESGEYIPEAPTIGLIARALNVSADYLLGLTDDPRRAARESDFTEQELEIVMALRRGDFKSAMRAMVNE